MKNNLLKMKFCGVLILILNVMACSSSSLEIPTDVDWDRTIAVESFAFSNVSAQQVALQEMSSCSQINNRLQRLAIARLENHWSNLENYCGVVATTDTGSFDNTHIANSDDGATQESSGIRYTEQNSQVAHVFEPDTVFTNGEYIFALNRSEVLIHKAWPVDEIEHVATISQGLSLGDYRLGRVSRFLLSGDDLVLFASVTDDEGQYWFGQVVMDVSDPANPTAKTAYLMLDADWTMKARLKGDRLVSLMSKNIAMTIDYYPDWDYQRDGEICSGDEVSSSYREAVQNHVAEEITRINADGFDVTSTLPDVLFVDFETDFEEQNSVPCDDVLVNDFTLGTQLTLVMNQDLDAPQASRATQGVLGYTSQIYMNGDSLILSSTVTPLFYRILNGDESQITSSVLHRFALTGDGVDYRASGFVPGTVPSQWAIDNDDHITRVVTHVFAFAEAQPVDVTFSVLEESAGRLETIGQITDIIANEEVFSVRYTDDRAYVVTYEVLRNHDPLFVIDMSSHTNPQILGSLEMSGFSSYLQMIDDGILLGLGQTDTQCWFSGCFGEDYKIALYNVQDESLPIEVSQDVVEVSFTNSFIDHLMVHYDQDLQTLFLPLNQGYNSQTGESDFEISIFDLRDAEVTETNRFDVDFSQTGNVLRTLLIGDDTTDPVLFVVGEEGIEVFEEY